MHSRAVHRRWLIAVAVAVKAAAEFAGSERFRVVHAMSHGLQCTEIGNMSGTKKKETRVARARG